MAALSIKFEFPAIYGQNYVNVIRNLRVKLYRVVLPLGRNYTIRMQQHNFVVIIRIRTGCYLVLPSGDQPLDGSTSVTRWAALSNKPYEF